MIRTALIALLLVGSAWADAPQSSLTLNELRAFTDAFGHVQREYIDETTDQQLLENAIRGMLSGLDAHTEYLTRREYASLTADTQAEYGGIGVDVLWQEDPIALRVVAVRDDSPAAAAGIAADQLIVAIDGEPIARLLPAEAVDRMRGPVGSQVNATLRDPADQASRTVTMTRQLIHIESVAKQLMADDIGHLIVTSFANDTAQTARRYLAELREQADGQLRGLVLDLRGNLGGVVTTAVGLADLFLAEGLIVYSQGRIESAEFRHHASGGDQLDGKPLVVLVDRMSASASEIVAGALQDHQRAVIVGERTFGKGSIQAVLPLRNGGAIKLTTSRYHTPSGRSISGNGIAPDIAVRNSADGDPALDAALQWISQAQATQ